MPDDFRTLIDAQTLGNRVSEIAQQIRDRYQTPPLLVAIAQGARVFASRLSEHLGDWAQIREIGARSYGDGTESSGEVEVYDDADLDPRGREVLLLEDIVDTGRTVARVREHLLGRGAVSVDVATVLSKPTRRVVPVDLRFTGFEIPDVFVVGFGMDLAGRYRDLDRVAVAHPERGRASSITQ